MAPITLTTIPGFADIPAHSLNAEQVALASHIGHMAANASFGLCQLEVFVGLYHDGDAVSLPISSFDGYAYSREELLYAWTVQSSVNPSTNWISGPDSLWFAAWKVDQTTGAVSTLEAYRRSGSNYQGAQSSDGTICVFTIAQRQRTNIIISAPLTAYTDIADSAFAQDKAWTTTLAEQMNINAKFGAVSSEVIYMGEFTDSQTVGVATSPKDGYVYSHSQMNLIHCWRWTTTASAFAVPDLSRGQLGPFQCTINQTTGIVSITVQMIDNNGNLNSYHDMGRVAVFALCSRSNLISGISARANAFAELNSAFFQPGSTLRASTLSQLNKNCREAALTHEFFGPTSYANGATIPLVTSPVDGYPYTRDEMFYIWDWEDTTNQTGTHLRLPLFLLNTASLPTISLQVWRLPPGGPALDDDNTHARVSVTVVAIRGSTHSVPANSTVAQPANSGTGIDQNAPIINPYTLVFDAMPGNQLAGSTTVPFLEHAISGQITSASFAAGLSDSIGGCRVAPAGSYSITIKKNGSSIGSIDFAASATVATFTFSSTQTFVPGDVISFFAPVTADGSGYFFTLTGTRQ